MSLLFTSKEKCLSLFLLLLLSVSALSKTKPTVHVVNYPLKYFAERIGGDMVDVEFPVPPDVDPAYWTPSPDIVREYQKADLILLNGADYAKWIKKATLPKIKIVNTSKSFKDQYVHIEDAITHTHGPKGEHAHAGIAFTTWLDPMLAIEQANAIKGALIKVLPEKEELLQNNFDSLKNDLIELHKNIQKIVSTNPEKPLLASHPVYQYLAKRYKLNLKSLHWEPDETPGLDQWQKLTNLLQTHPAKWMLWEDTPLDETKEQLESLGINSTVFNPIANTPEKGDYMSVMKHNVDNLKMAFQK